VFLLNVLSKTPAPFHRRVIAEPKLLLQKVDRDGSLPEWTALAMWAEINGESYVPLRTFACGKWNAGQAVRVAQNLVYELMLLDCGADGLLPRQPAGDVGGDGELPSQFSMCLGVVNADECLNASLELDLILCYGTGNFQLARSISCPVNLQKRQILPPSTYLWYCTLTMTGSGQRLTRHCGTRPNTQRHCRTPRS
jgi:hypothetical protein